MNKQQEIRIKELRSRSYGTLQRTKEYKEFLEKFIYSESKNVNPEVSYILSKSFEDSEAPFSWDDVTNLTYFDVADLKADMFYNISETEEDLKELFNSLNDEFNRKIKTIGDVEVFLNSLDEEEIKELAENNEYFKFFNIADVEEYERQNEILSWFIMDSRIIEQLEERGEPTLEGTYWGRCTFGQAIELDGVIIEIFKEWYLSLYGVDLYDEKGELIK